MSRVTNLILTFSTLEDVNEIIPEISQYEPGFYIVSVEDNKLQKDWYGGTKRLECNILIGAYNGLDLAAFLLFLREKVDWYAADLVQLIVKEEDDFKFKLIDLVPE
ncbi:hypothetical protein [Chitinophaga sp. Cy-1792]|uniref:hypothetical protein n=1 Tax=Chitinophaga sp. Cy-1792 TaxID=2608339 RepID=UPI001421FEF9|nr:hypothetical protein [Chitinophaga sp. Cy-1792]NIG55392.1 hypothetical protein [Chitinophaga sp. Cy-1792]